MAQPTTSSSFTYGWSYDVFLSFRGEDTRSGFTGHFYNALCQRGIYTFIDDDGLRRGEEITPSLFEAIETSRIAVIVFSENYASSTFCLDELVSILECMKAKGRLVWPVFYNIDPSHVRHQRGSYGEALEMHERKFQNVDNQKVKKWRLALSVAANLSGWHFKYGHEYEYQFMGRIIQEVSKRVNRIPLHVANFPVGLELRVQNINSLLAIGSNDGVIMVGIYGMGGIGKSTIARAVYNSIADNFNGLCFLADIREKSTNHGLVQLQKTMLSELFGDKDIKWEDVYRGIPILKSRLLQKKILLVLDDVDKLEQLNAVAGGANWFGSGSRIIITTRNEHLLDIHGVKRKYEVKELNHEKAHELFMWNAFKNGKVDQCYMDISNRVVLCANGHPLALEVVGSNLFGKNLNKWNSTLSKYERNSDKKIHEVLKVSYDGLEEDEKEIFLDIACFFKGRTLEFVNKMLLYSRDYQSNYAIRVLNAKSLINIQFGKVEMHDLIQDMSREIVQQESVIEPSGRSRLWFHEDILHVLEENTGTEKIQLLMLESPTDEEVHWNGKAFKKMKNLRVLIIKKAHFSTGCKHLPNSLRVLDWKGYPSSSLPSEFYPRKLFILNLPYSSLVSLDSLQNLRHLRKMDFSHCKFLRQVPDLSEAPNLRALYLDECTNLTEIHDSVGFLDKLQVLSAKSCFNLKNLPRAIKLTSLRELFVSNCRNLRSFPEVMGQMENVLHVNLAGTAIEKLPFSFQNMIGLGYLDVRKCTRLKQLPISILILPVLFQIMATSTTGIQFLRNHEDQEQEQDQVTSMVTRMTSLCLDDCFFTNESIMKCLSSLCNVNVFDLDLSGCTFTILPECLKECCSLHILKLDNCKQLQEIKGIPPRIKILSARNCISMTSQCSSILMSQPIHEAQYTKFMMTGTRIPKWFDHCIRGHTVSFWFRKRFPAIALLVVVGDFNSELKLELDFNVIINGTQYHWCLTPYATSILETEHTILFDLDRIRTLSHKFLHRFNLLPEWIQAQWPEWNQAQIVCIPRPYGVYQKATIKWLGVHVYRQLTSTQDVRFP